jgi:1,4-dihydroxy-6-naphthoate synthase
LTAPDPILLGHSPDPDDAFMFYGLAEGKVDAEGLRFEHVLQDIETLNRRALDGDLHVTAVSLHAFGHMNGKYGLLACGASVGDDYGPVVVAKKPMEERALKGKRIAIPGTLTTAYLVTRLHTSRFVPVPVRFDWIPEAVAAGEVDAGVLIHEGQLTYREQGLELVVDLGKWWKRQTHCPLPLGANAVRLDLGEEVVAKIGRVLRRSIEYGLAHRAAGVEHAMKFGRGIDREKADRFIGMYVNDYTLDLGPAGREGVRQLMAWGMEAGMLPVGKVEVSFVG